MQWSNLSKSCGLMCYSCTAADPKSCTDTTSCAVAFNRCYSLRVDGELFFHMRSSCVSPISCCEGDLCNSAIPTGPSVILLLVSSAILKLLF
uniref:Uncharacterized protein n=1 Tax=Amphilophus citrinellus TaxID=61819 RepID=A0A3Q0RBC6_AMPCI